MDPRPIVLAPSLLAANFANLAHDLNQLTDAGITALHLDIMDGQFVPNLSFGLPVVESIRAISPLFFDVHLMISHPSLYISHFAKAGADLITFHLEVAEDVNQNIAAIKQTGRQVGLAINPNTALELLLPYVKDLDQVTIMTVEAGFGGQAFLPDMLSKIKRLRAYADAYGVALDIQVDGGVNATNIQAVVEAGANVIVAGSAVFKGDGIGVNVAQLNKLINR